MIKYFLYKNSNKIYLKECPLLYQLKSQMLLIMLKIQVSFFMSGWSRLTRHFVEYISKEGFIKITGLAFQFLYCCVWCPSSEVKIVFSLKTSPFFLPILGMDLEIYLSNNAAHFSNDGWFPLQNKIKIWREKKLDLNVYTNFFIFPTIQFQSTPLFKSWPHFSSPPLLPTLHAIDR